jgi:hypothetical protein
MSAPEREEGSPVYSCGDKADASGSRRIVPRERRLNPGDVSAEEA